MQLFVRAERTHCLEVSGSASVGDVVTALEQASGVRCAAGTCVWQLAACSNIYRRWQAG